jgi:hypothetical protein
MMTVLGGTMHIKTRSHVGVAARGIAVAGIAAMVASPLAPVAQTQPPPVMSHDVSLAAVTVPPGGLVASFLGNQVIYCSFNCPLLIETGVTAAVTTLQTPGTFFNALQSGDLLKAIGVTAASVTGPTTSAASAAILSDATLIAPRALNAFETGVVGLLNIVPAAAGGLPGVVEAIQTARQDTFTALNLPIVPNPTPTVMPNGVVQVAVVSAINVGAAVIFPAFNDVLAGAFQIPDDVAQELAATGDPVRATAAGVNTAAGVATAATGVVADSVLTAVRNIRTAAGQSSQGNVLTQKQGEKFSATTTSSDAKADPPRRLSTPAKHASAEPGFSKPLRNVATRVRQATRSAMNTAFQSRHSAVSEEAKRLGRGDHRVPK